MENREIANKRFFQKLFYPTSFKRFIFFFLADILIITLSLYLSFLLRFDFTLEDKYKELIINVLPLFLLIKLLFLGFFRVYWITWRHVGINELFNIINALVIAELVLMVLILVPLPPYLLALIGGFFGPISTGFPKSIFLIDLGISILLFSGLRISKRLFLEIICKRRNLKQGLRTIIIGAGNTGEMLLRDINKQKYSQFYPIGFLDDDERKLGTYIHGIKVLARTDKLKDIIRKYTIEALIIAIPSLNYKVLRRIYDNARECGIKTIKIVPRIYEFHKPIIHLKSLEEIQVEDLIGRQPVRIDYNEIENFFKEKVVLVTGAGGSIGSEIVAQICAFHPNSVILFDIDETALHNMSLRLNQLYPDFSKVYFVVGDIRDFERVREVFERFTPQIVFHSAAYKHVPMMEYNPSEAVKVNIFGTYNLAKISVEIGVKRFILISTDKAVRPTSIMGATKRLAEDVCRAFNNLEEGKTEFVSVRFGNVLGSRGSVLPLFMEQLKHGGPLTITHKDMKRYFMTIPEAVSLVLQASVIGKGGDILVLDMGEPIKIVSLAEELIRIHGMEPYKDIDIKFIGLRPGEKLFEEILTAEEGTIASKHERIFIARNSEKITLEKIESMLKNFSDATTKQSLKNKEIIKDLLRQYVKHFVDS